MSRRRTLFFIGTGTLTLALGAASGIAGCQSNTGTGTGGTGTGGEGTTTGTNTSSSSGTTSSSTSTSSGGTGGAPQDATIQQITGLADAGIPIGPGIKVEVKGVVAMSHKFLVSQSSKGSCLWGVFLSAPGLTETAAYTGVLGLSYGTEATIPPGGDTDYCPTIQKGDAAGDAFPDDVKPGDVLDVTGKTDSYISMSCGTKPGDSTVAQTQLANITKATKTGTAAVPAPHVMSAMDIAGQTDASIYKQWGGVKVRTENVTAMDANPPKDPAYPIVGNFGAITLQGSNLVVGDKVYFHPLLNSQKDICHSGPHYAASQVTFTKIDGFVYLDFCTWGLQPENRCVDLAPPSDDCGAETCP